MSWNRYDAAESFIASLMGLDLGDDARGVFEGLLEELDLYQREEEKEARRKAESTQPDIFELGEEDVQGWMEGRVPVRTVGAPVAVAAECQEGVRGEAYPMPPPTPKPAREAPAGPSSAQEASTSPSQGPSSEPLTVEQEWEQLWARLKNLRDKYKEERVREAELFGALDMFRAKYPEYRPSALERWAELVEDMRAARAGQQQILEDRRKERRERDEALQKEEEERLRLQEEERLRERRARDYQRQAERLQDRAERLLRGEEEPPKVRYCHKCGLKGVKRHWLCPRAHEHQLWERLEGGGWWRRPAV